MWRVGPDGLLYAEAFRDSEADVDWLVSPPVQAAPPEETYSLALCAVPKPSAIEADCLTAELTASGERLTLRYLFQVFPECRGVRMRLTVEGDAGAEGPGETTDDQAGPTGVEADAARPGTRDSRETDALDALTLAPLHLRLTQVTLRDQTDSHNELVSEKEWLLHPSEAPLMLSGCLFSVEDVLTGAGLIFVKEAPLPEARPVSSPHDLRVHPGERRVTFAGHGAGVTGEGYAFATMAYAGGKAGRTAALQRYQRCLRPYVPARDALLVSNTWGDRNRDGRIDGDFTAQEIEAGARLGVDVIQIDDGWQIGATSNSVRAKSEGGVWEGFYAAWDDFWSVNPKRFPIGLAPLVAEAREKGMRFGLWFGPDSAGDFANWRRDADTVLRLHRDLGIDDIKIDGVKVRTKAGERNLHAFFDAVLNESAGRVVFDLDVTAEVRPGYFGLVRGGPLFVENRYTDWHRYWPHQTLRNLWKLAHHVDPVRLRMEFLNHARNDDKYAHDPLAPSAYRPDCLFATVMFSSPLGWFEVSNLPQTYFAEAAPLISVWKRHREAIFSGTILPLGDAPDGMAWTGFASLAPDRLSAYILVFREASPSSEWQTTCPFLPDVAHPVAGERLGGDGDATLLPGRRLAVTISEARRFLFIQFDCYTGAEQSRAKKPQSGSIEEGGTRSWE
jgi:alpha-galactosidase